MQQHSIKSCFSCKHSEVSACSIMVTTSTRRWVVDPDFSTSWSDVLKITLWQWCSVAERHFSLQSSLHLSPWGWQKAWKHEVELLSRDEVHYHVDDAWTAGAAAQVHARFPDFVLQQLVQLPAQLLHQFSHLDKHTFTELSSLVFFHLFI